MDFNSARQIEDTPPVKPHGNLHLRRPTVASTSAPASANHVRPSRPRRNATAVQATHRRSGAFVGASTRISSGEPASTSRGVKVTELDCAGACPRASASARTAGQHNKSVLGIASRLE